MKYKLNITCILFLTILISPGIVLAADKYNNLSALSNAEITQRLRFVEDRLGAGQKHAGYWQRGWTGFYAAATVVQGVVAATDDDRDDRVNNLFGAVKSAAGLADVLLRPLPGRHGADTLQAMPRATREEMIRRLGQAEETLYRAADRSREKKAWKSHLKVVGVNLACGALIWGFGDNNDALRSTALGLVLGETAIWTQPSRAIQDVQDYEDRFVRPRAPDTVNWQIAPCARGLALQVQF